MPRYPPQSRYRRRGNGERMPNWRIAMDIAAVLVTIAVGAFPVMTSGATMSGPDNREAWPASVMARHIAAARNCAAARAVGLAPARRGQPGYHPHLDRDNDGIACEPWYGHVWQQVEAGFQAVPEQPPPRVVRPTPRPPQ